MIEEQIKIHDKFSIEIKLRLAARRKAKKSEFAVNTWLFIPAALDINHSTYSKNDFYHDLKSNIRLITPVYLLRDIAAGENSPLAFLTTVFQKVASSPTRTLAAEYEYHIKMFLSVLKSSLREEIQHILNNKLPADTAYLIDEFCKNISQISKRYRELHFIINAPTISEELMNYYSFGDEFMSNLIEEHTFKLLASLKQSHPSFNKTWQKQLLSIVQDEIKYKKEHNYPVVEEKSPTRNRELISHFNLLKKFAESELFLTGEKKKEGILVEQIYFSIAAGLSMVFATAVAFTFQLKYGSLTMPLFVALVVSYMLKDRIKELFRYYFASHLGHRYFDHKTEISLNNITIGISKEGMDFIPEKKVLSNVMKIRSRSPILEVNNRYDTEKIILYRKILYLDRRKLNELSLYLTPGINEILRLNVDSFIQKMDDPEVPLFIPDENKGYAIINGERIYYINLIMQLSSENETAYRRYRILLNRKGIKAIENLS